VGTAEHKLGPILMAPDQTQRHRQRHKNKYTIYLAKLVGLISLDLVESPMVS
jgi:hypothetical protein